MQILSAFFVYSLEKNDFFIYYLAAPEQTLDYYHGDSHFYPILISVLVFLTCRFTTSFVRRLDKNNLVSIGLSRAIYQLGFEPRSFACDRNVLTH